MFSMFGWTPGLRSGLKGRLLACGCLIGAYQTWSGSVVEILDARGDECRHAIHRVNTVLDGPKPGPEGDDRGQSDV
jgi:hypothetical protein